MSKRLALGSTEAGEVVYVKVPLLQESQTTANPSQPALQIATGPLIQVNGKLVQME